jgi:hypothetical protein
MPPTKTLRFDPEVVDEIRTMRWSDDGLVGVLVNQLDKALYARVNKALLAMGGCWDRKAGGHVFHADPRPQVEGLLDSGALVIARDGFFETPDAVTDRMIAEVGLPAGADVLEPSAGAGKIVRRLLFHQRSLNITCVEQNEARCGLLRAIPGVTVFQGDFMTHKLKYMMFDRIVMNPPFECFNGVYQDIAHITRAFNDFLYSDGRMASVISEGAFFRDDRQSEDFRDLIAAHGRCEVLPEHSFRESGTDVRTRLVFLAH